MPGSFFKFTISILLLFAMLSGCNGKPWNNPYPNHSETANIYYSSFTEQPKTLDPARSYSADETLFIAQIYEPPLQYHYLLVPYTLIPLTTKEIPKPEYEDVQRHPLPQNTPLDKIAYSVYRIQIRPGIFYQPHPAFAKKPNGDYYYQHLTAQDLGNIKTLHDFPHTGTRELTADDYVYEIKRLADPRVESPVYGVLTKYIVGFSEFGEQIKKLPQTQPKQFLDLRNIPLAGVKAIDRYTYQITINGVYPQFLYWLAMPFFAPIPWEADHFYSQPGMAEKNLSFAWYPVGTGAYLLEENNPNSRMVLAKNPNFHGEQYPSQGVAGDERFLVYAKKPLPFIDKFVFTLERESIPRWNKFLQGYYDQSAIGSDSFEQAINLLPNGKPEVTPVLKNKNIRLQTSTSPSMFYIGFNMLDPIVGGYGERARKLRQAIAIIYNNEEYITIFLNGRATVAQGPLPPGIFGYRSGIHGVNPYIYDVVNDQIQRKSIKTAKNLLAAAGYPGGIDPKTGKPLLLHYDAISGGTADDKAVFSWLQKQFAKLNVELEIRDTQYNRFQEKIRTGQEQIFTFGWNADYPDPENFLFLFYGPNQKVAYGGENAVNYHNKEYDQLFEKMRNMPNGAARQAVIDRMIDIVRKDSPWIFGFYPQSFVLTQNWVGPIKANQIANNTLKYISINPELRAQDRFLWNQPILWPLLVVILLIMLIIGILYFYYWQRQHYIRKK